MAWVRARATFSYPIGMARLFNTHSGGLNIKLSFRLLKKLKMQGVEK